MPLTKITGFGKFLLKKNGKEILAALREKVEAVKINEASQKKVQNMKRSKEKITLSILLAAVLVVGIVGYMIYV